MPEPSTRVSASMEELGSTGLRRSHGRIIDEFLRPLRGKQGRLVYREMSDNDPIVGALLFGIERLMAGLDWRIDPASDAPVAIEQADFVESALHDMSSSWDSTLGEILSMLPQGFAPLEVVYKRRIGPEERKPSRRSKFTDARIGWRKLTLRGQDTVEEWLFDEDGGIDGLRQNDPSIAGGSVSIPIEKLLLFRTTTARSNPEGRSVLRNAYRPWYFKRRIEEFESIGIERDLAGLPVAHVPPDYLARDAPKHKKAILAAIVDIVQNVKRNEQEGVVFPRVYDETGHSLFELELLSTGGQRQFDTDSIIGRHDQRIAMTVLADFILLGHEATGTYALGQSKVDLFTQAIASWATGICEVVNAHAIPRLLRLNGMDLTLAPTLEIGDVSHVDLEQLAQFVAVAAGVGALTIDDGLEQYLRQVANLPAIDPATQRELDKEEDDDEDTDQEDGDGSDDDEEEDDDETDES